MKPDLIACWPRDIFYPFFVERINRSRELFGRVIVVMTQKAMNFDFSDYLNGALKRAMIIKKYDDNGRDWRNAATNKALEYVLSPSVLFWEQDFLVRDGFFERLFEQAEGLNMVGFADGNRLHPACLLVKKEIIGKTSKDFSAYPPVGDHFCKFTEEAKALGSWKTLQEMSLPDWYHLAGLSQNYRLEGNYYKGPEFLTYNFCCKRLKMPYEWEGYCSKKFDFTNFEPEQRIAEFFEDL